VGVTEKKRRYGKFPPLRNRQTEIIYCPWNTEDKEENYLALYEIIKPACVLNLVFLVTSN